MQSQDRWSSLMDFAAAGTSSADVFYRWVDYLDRPINAEQYARGREVYLLYEDSDSRWHLQGISKSTRKLPRRLFSDADQARSFLRSQGFELEKTIPVMDFPASTGDEDRWPQWLGWLLFVLLLIAVFAMLLFLMWNIDKADMSNVSP